MRTLVTAHINADFDAAAAAFGASRLFASSDVLIPGSANRNVREFLTLHEDLVALVEESDLVPSRYGRVVLVDTSEVDRVGRAAAVVERPAIEVVVYDHHPRTEASVRGARYVIEEVGAVTTVLVEELLRRGVALSEAEATFLALGIHEDTGSLSFPSTTARDAKALAALYEAGAKPEVVARYLHSHLTDEQHGLLLSLIRESRHYRFGDVAAVFAGVRTRGFVEGASTVAHRLMDLENCDVLVVALESGDRVHCILRSRTGVVDCLRLGAAFGAGGHAQAATAVLRGWTLESVERHFVDYLGSLRPGVLRAADIMSRVVRTVAPEDTVSHAMTLMKRYGHSGFPVVEKGKVVGVITRKEVEKAVAHDLTHAPVKGFMTRDVAVVGPSEPVDALARLFTERRIGRAPVLESGRLVGIVTRTDILRALYGQRYVTKGLLPGDAELARRLEEFLGPRLFEVVRLAGFIADELGYRAYLVGGIIRDLILGERNPDVDIVVLGQAIPVAERVVKAVGGRIDAHERFGTAVAILADGSRVDFASARKEYYARPGALPEVEEGSLEEDMRRRDFAINALAMSLSRRDFGRVVDVVGGLRDMERRQIRILHNLSFVEDPTRLVRAIRFAVRLGFELESTTEALAHEAVAMGVVEKSLGVRMRDEIVDVLREERALEALAALDRVGILGSLHPRLSFGPARLRQARALLRLLPRAEGLGLRVERDLWLLAVLLHGLGAEAATELLERLKFRREQATFVASVATLKRHARRVAELPLDRAYFELARYPDEAVFVVHAMSQGSGAVRAAFGLYLEKLRFVRPHLRGRDIIELGLAPGPAVGMVKRELLRARILGEVTTVAEERALAKRLIAKARAGGATTGGARG